VVDDEVSDLWTPGCHVRAYWQAMSSQRIHHVTGPTAYERVVDNGRAALLAGDLSVETPPVDGQRRWGLAMLLRPEPAMLSTLAALAERAAGLASADSTGERVHWAHGPSLLHVSLRALDRYRAVAPYPPEIGGPVNTDPAMGDYADALDEAVRGLPAISVRVRTVSPHPGGVAVHVHPADDALEVLYERVRDALHRRDRAGYETWSRGRAADEPWYINIVHFTGPVDVGRLIAWCDARRHSEIGATTLRSAELVRYHHIRDHARPRHTGTGMRAETLHRSTLGDRRSGRNDSGHDPEHRADPEHQDQ
jgi:hypothetical protein